MEINNLKINLGKHIQKSYTEGIYADTYQNRKLGRVGMSYGTKLDLENFEDVVDKGQEYTANPRLILKRLKNKISERKFNFIRSLMEKEDFILGDIIEWKGKVIFTKSTEVSPKDKDFINIGDRTSKSHIEDKYYKFFEDNYNKEKLEGRLFSEKRGLLEQFFEGYNSIDYLINYYKIDIVSNTSKQLDEISDEEAIEYLKEYGADYHKQDLNFYLRYYNLIQKLQKYNINPTKSVEENKEAFNNFILNCPRVEFYNIIKDFWNPNFRYDVDTLIRYRFALKYNKILAGNGWDKVTDNKGNFVKAKRDDILELCKQIEYSIDEVLGEDKDLFIKNPNIKYIAYQENIDWGGASYSEQNKVITITDEYFKSIRRYKRNNTNETLTREKFLVEGLIHEIGHSIDIGILNSKEYKDFAEHLGYDENSKYTIYTNAIKTEGDKFGGQDNYLSVERDKKEIEEKFRKLYKESIKDSAISEPFNFTEVFISDYSAKSACEGFAEYFSFYLSNKEKIDESIKKYRENPTKFLDEIDPKKDWYKYSIFNRKWNTYKENENKYFKEIIKHNIEMFEDIFKIINNVKNKFEKDEN